MDGALKECFDTQRAKLYSRRDQALQLLEEVKAELAQVEAGLKVLDELEAPLSESTAAVAATAVIEEHKPVTRAVRRKTAKLKPLTEPDDTSHASGEEKPAEGTQEALLSQTKPEPIQPITAWAAKCPGAL